MEQKKDEKIGQALLKVALGYQLAEVTEEYAEVDGALKLTKRKKTKKDVPPDLKAVQLLLSSEGGEYTQWSDEELESERQRLLASLREEENKSKEKKARGGASTKKKAERSSEKVEEGSLSAADDEKKGKKPRPKPRKRVVRKTNG